MKKNTPLNWSPGIVIRKRTMNETRDLALRILGRNFKALLPYYLTLALPVYAFNLLLWGVLFFVVGPLTTGASYDPVAREIEILAIIYATILYESSFVGSLTTAYLGVWLFAPDERAIKYRSVVRTWRSSWFQLVYYLILTRIIRTRVFYPETILLEKTPFRSRSDRISTKERVRNINLSFQGVFSTGFFSMESYMFAGVLSGGLLFSGLVKGLFPDSVVYLFIINAAIVPALVFGSRLYVAVYRFFSYINYRIESEGWDLDLAFRTELSKRSRVDEEDQTIPARFRRSKTLAPIHLDADAFESEEARR